MAKDPIETLAKNNVSVEFLDNLKAYVNNPFYNWVFKLLKMDKNVALRGIETAKQYLSKQKMDIESNTVPNNPNHLYSNQAPIDDLDKFKRGLNRLK